MQIKVLSIIEPWATLIKEGKKRIETRSWKTSYRGELYLHASSKHIDKKNPYLPNLLNLIPNISMGYGNIICKCKLVDCIYMDEVFMNQIKLNPQEFMCGEYKIGRYAWILEDVEVLKEPIPAKGHLNIWNFNISSIKIKETTAEEVIWGESGDFSISFSKYYAEKIEDIEIIVSRAYNKFIAAYNFDLNVHYKDRQFKGLDFFR